MSTTNFNPFSGPPIERIIYTTKSQSEIWTDCTIGGEDASKAYTISTRLEMKGSLDLSAINMAIKTVVERHESLRSVFSPDGTYMTIFKTIEPDVIFHDLANKTNFEQEATLNDYLKKEVETNFDLVNGPLIKFGILKFSDLDYQIVITAHHIICDGWSMSIILQDLSTLYSAYVKGLSPKTPVPVKFSDYADELHSLMESSEYNKIENYWIDLYKQPIPVVDLPTDYVRPSKRTYKSNRINFQLNTTLIEEIKQTATQSGCSFVSTLISAFEIFLYQLTGQNNLALGLPTSGQSSTGMTHLVGHCVNLLPLRTTINSNSSFSEYLKLRKNQIFDAYEHDKISFGQLLQKLPIARDPSRIPLVPVVINFETNPEEGVYFEGLTTTLKSNVKLCETFEIFLNTVISKDQVRFEWSYKTDLFNASSIEKMMTSFESLLGSLISDVSSPLSKLLNENLSSEYSILNQTHRLYPDTALHELILAKASRLINRDAIIFQQTSITYGTLRDKVNQLSHYLLGQGIKNGDIVAVSLPRCQELSIVLLAIMQCGATYLPLDPTYPQSRLDFMLEDSEARLIITDEHITAFSTTKTPKIFLSDVLKQLADFPSIPLNIKVAPTSPCYILYTSGSTGKPKGVTVSHKNLVNFLFSMAEKPGIEETDRLLSITTISFDIAGLELFLPLLTGATLVIADDNTARDGRLLHELLIKEQITILQATPTTWQMLLDSGWKNPLPIKALCGGEALPLNLAQDILSKCDTLWNMYGPTETTIWSSVKLIDKNDQIITIGKPIANTQIYILNEQGQLATPGSIGEIAIGGDGVSLGYLKRPALTSEKFIHNPFNTNTGNVLYRTGDLGKLLPNGEIQCLGRIDQQVKIRGHRIELGEIEQALSSLDDISSAVVLSDSENLLAFVVPNKPLSKDFVTSTINEWKNILKADLPLHLIPKSFTILDHFPTTLNGKIDRKALSETENIETTKVSYVAPRTKAEAIVAEIWKSCLGLENIDIFSNFFELGGHSLIAVKVMRQIEEETGKRLPLSSLFEYSTIEKLAELLNLDKEITSDSLVPIQPLGNKTPIFFIHGAGLHVFIFYDLVKNLDKNQPAYALEGTRINQEDNPFDTIQKIASHYVESIIKVQPHGPYAIAGYSFGGIIAYEMGRQLMSQGKKISMLSIIDTNVDPQYYYASPLAKKLAKTKVLYKRRFTYLKEMLSGWDTTIKHINRKKNFIKEYYLNKPTFETNDDELIFKEYLVSNSKVSEIENRYHMVPAPLKIDLFKAKNNNDFQNDSYLGWGQVALGGVVIHEIPGDHLNIFREPNVIEFAELFQKVLDERHAIK